MDHMRGNEFLRFPVFLTWLFLAIPAGAIAADAEHGTVVSLEATSSTHLPNNEVVVFYRIEASGTEPNALSQKVNNTSQVVHARLKGEKNLKQATLSRRMEILWRYDKTAGKQVRDGWKLVQREQVTSSNLEAVADWVDAIEKVGAHLDSLNFQISEAALKTAREELRMQAVETFRIKAEMLAKSLDARSFRILHLQTGSQPPVYPVRRAIPEVAMMRATSDSTPNLNASESKISISVSGQILLPEKDFRVQ
jgi:predicted secreted protein